MSSDSSFPIRNLNSAQSKLQSSFSKLSSGVRITKASDDAAGLAIAEALKSDAVTLSQGSRNASDGVSLIEIRDGALGQIGEIQGRLKELATQSANGTLSDEQRASLSQEFNALREEAGRIAESTSFNGQNVFSGSDTSLQVGVDSGSDSQIKTGASDVSSAIATLGGLDISSQAGAQAAISGIDGFSKQVSELRGKGGAAEVRLETAIKNNEVAKENLLAAESRIRDVDVASEAANLVKNQILSQGSAAISAQANLNKATVLNLLK